MKAWVLKDIGNIIKTDVNISELKPGEVRIAVKAAGICGSDIPRIYETGAHVMPLILGHEFSGIVDAVGAGVNKELLGKRVSACPKIPCKKCAECLKGRKDNCLSYDYVGSRRDGAFSEYVNVPAAQLIMLPDEVSFEQGAMLEPLAVSANAVRTGLKKGEVSNIAVCGLGTIGLMTVMLLKEQGFSNIYVLGKSEAQKKKAEDLGISPEFFCNSKETDPSGWLNEKTKNEGIDLYFECAGSNESIRYGIVAGSYGANLVMVGNPRGDIDLLKDTYWRILRRQMKLLGIWNSCFFGGSKEAYRENKTDAGDCDDWSYVLNLIRENKIHPEELISHRLSIDDLYKGFLIMRDKTEDYTKVMMV